MFLTSMREILRRLASTAGNARRVDKLPWCSDSRQCERALTVAVKAVSKREAARGPYAGESRAVLSCDFSNLEMVLRVDSEDAKWVLSAFSVSRV